MCQPYLEAPWAIPACEKQNKTKPLPVGCSPCTAATSAHRRASGVAPGLFTFFTWCDRCDTKVLRNVCWMNTLTRRLQQGPAQCVPPHRHTGTSSPSCSSLGRIPHPIRPLQVQLVGRRPLGTSLSLPSSSPPAAPLDLPHRYMVLFWSSPAHGLPEGRPPAYLCVPHFLNLKAQFIPFNSRA